MLHHWSLVQPYTYIITIYIIKRLKYSIQKRKDLEVKCKEELIAQREKAEKERGERERAQKAKDEKEQEDRRAKMKRDEDEIDKQNEQNKLEKIERHNRFANKDISNIKESIDKKEYRIRTTLDYEQQKQLRDAIPLDNSDSELVNLKNNIIIIAGESVAYGYNSTLVEKLKEDNYIPEDIKNSIISVISTLNSYR